MYLSKFHMPPILFSQVYGTNSANLKRKNPMNFLFNTDSLKSVGKIPRKELTYYERQKSDVFF
jgi:hypothetical protein